MSANHRFDFDRFEILRLERLLAVTCARDEAMLFFSETQALGEQRSGWPGDAARLRGAADLSRHFELVGLHDAGQHAFDAGNLRSRFESQRLAVVRFHIGLARAQADLETGALDFDAHFLGRDDTLCIDFTGRMHAADLATIEQHAHPYIIRGRGVRNGDGKGNDRHGEVAQHGSFSFARIDKNNRGGVSGVAFGRIGVSTIRARGPMMTESQLISPYSCIRRRSTPWVR